MKKILKTMALILIIILFIPIGAFADTLKINIKASKDKVNVGDKVKITVSWDEGMQAADFTLEYDVSKLEFVKSDLQDDYINSINGKVKTAWFSMDNIDKTKIEYIFKAKETGIAEFETKVNGGFATGELVIPNSYQEGHLTLKIEEQSIITKILKIFLIFLLVYFGIRIYKNITKQKKKSIKRSV